MTKRCDLARDSLGCRPAGCPAARLVLAAALAVGCLLIPWARAQEDAPADDARSISLTAYNTDLGLVKEVRTLPIAEGTGWVRFRDVPARIDPTSVHLKPADGQDLAVLEQNYEYDLISSQKILERYLDSPVRVILEEGRLYEGTLLSAQDGSLVLGGVGARASGMGATGGARGGAAGGSGGSGPGGASGGASGSAGADQGLVILNREKVTDIQFPALPQGLITRPTLAWLLSTGSGGERQVEVSYLTSGINWHAEYVAIVSDDDRAMDLAGWVSVDNRSGATYPDAQLQLVAGDVQRIQPSPARGGRAQAVDFSLAMAEKVGFEEETFFEYHLYTLARRTTLRDNETKQISLFDPATCGVTKIYECHPQRDGKKVRVVLETTNSQETGLGMALPKGKVRAYQRDKRGQIQFLGEDLIDHTPRDEKIRVTTGKAFDLVVERTEMAARSLGPRDREEDISIELRNRKAEGDVTIVVQEDLSGIWEIRRASHDYEKKSATRIEFKVPVKAGQTVTVTYTVRYTW